MNSYESDRPRRRSAAILFLLILVIGGAAAGVWYLGPRFESEPPQVAMKPDTDALGVAPVEITISDKGSGLKSIEIKLGEATIASERFESPIKDKTFSVAAAKLPGIKEGATTLRVVARDASLFRGNEATVQKNLTIDVTPPTINLVADDRYVNFGGVGAIVYQPSPDTVTSGVRIGSHFFPGAKGVIKDHPERFFALFAHAYDVPQNAKALLVATDKAGNTREMPIAYELKDFRYRKSTIMLGDGFLQTKVTPLVADAAARNGSPKDVFIAVNKKLRKENEDKITEITRKASPSILWKGAFVQLSNSKVEANFADHRTYVYNGEPVDSAYHLGYDLSVTKRYPVEAANSGAVVFAGDLGIYGNTVILDHGIGLFTLYSHLSQISVKPGDQVEKKQILGNTGETGLAAGDHLHYGVYLHGVAILPVEWWDAKWIEDNITPKLAGMSGDAIHEAQQPTRASRAKRKR
ncbi:MAG TPA: M23 family metallopeptidase [Burkholderiales bacterium]|nr:M23 family metallopeptidase [Burkholderiales bacterium]